MNQFLLPTPSCGWGVTWHHVSADTRGLFVLHLEDCLQTSILEKNKTAGAKEVNGDSTDAKHTETGEGSLPGRARRTRSPSGAQSRKKKGRGIHTFNPPQQRALPLLSEAFAPAYKYAPLFPDRPWAPCEVLAPHLVLRNHDLLCLQPHAQAWLFGHSEKQMGQCFSMRICCLGAWSTSWLRASWNRVL